MQEEVENRTLTLVVSGTKFTGRLLKAAISKYMAHRKEKKLQKQRSRDAPVTPHGKQTVKQLIGQNQGISNIAMFFGVFRWYAHLPTLPAIGRFSAEGIPCHRGIRFCVGSASEARHPARPFSDVFQRRRGDGGIHIPPFWRSPALGTRPPRLSAVRRPHLQAVSAAACPVPAGAAGSLPCRRRRMPPY